MEMTVLVAGVGTAICLTTIIGVMWWAGKPYRPEDAVKAQIKAMRSIQMKNGTPMGPDMPYMLV
jgi:hypothetical protein